MGLGVCDWTYGIDSSILAACARNDIALGLRTSKYLSFQDSTSIQCLHVHVHVFNLSLSLSTV